MCLQIRFIVTTDMRLFAVDEVDLARKLGYYLEILCYFKRGIRNGSKDILTVIDNRNQIAIKLKHVF